MKAFDIINQLQAIIPIYTPKFSETISISSLTKSAAIATATSNDHGLITGDTANIKGALLHNPITSLTRVDTIATVVTQFGHDLTLSPFQRTNTFITIGGANEVEYNGSKKLLSVVDKNTFTFEVSGSPATPATGSPYLVENLAELYNGFKEITKIDDNNFSYTLRKEPYASAAGTIPAVKSIRIRGGATFERCLAAYTAKALDKYWMFVVLGQTIASKGRDNQTDSVNKISSQDDYRLNLYQPFLVYIFMPAVEKLAARDLRDEIEDIRVWLFKSLLGVKFDSSFNVKKQYLCSFVSDNIENYSGPYYIHRFIFENTYDINKNDIVAPSLSVAFREFEFSQKNIDTGLEIRNVKGELP